MRIANTGREILGHPAVQRQQAAGKPLFAFGTATASDCALAKKEAEKIAKHNLGTNTRHV